MFWMPRNRRWLQHQQQQCKPQPKMEDANKKKNMIVRNTIIMKACITDNYQKAINRSVPERCLLPVVSMVQHIRLISGSVITYHVCTGSLLCTI